MTTSDTPRTDAAAVSSEFIRREMDYYAHKFVLAEHARQLERETRELREALQDITDFPPSFFDRTDEETVVITVLGRHLKAARAALAKVQP